MAEIIPSVTLDSVLSINITNGNTISRGSGVLFASGNYVLTAAHLFNTYISGQKIDIVSANGEVLSHANIFKHHSWNMSNNDINHDLAIIKLSSPSSKNGLSLWVSNDYEGVSFIFTGFGNEGSLHTGSNIFDGDGAIFNTTHNTNIVTSSQVLYDYDNGNEIQNISKGLLGLNSTTIPTDNETLAKQGDSGGALLVNNQIAGISSYIYRNAVHDVNNVVDSSFGEIGVATMVSSYIPWIEYITEGNPIYSLPEVSSAVDTSIAEPFSSSVINYFLLKMATASSEPVRLKYITKDGTARAGLDYARTEGWAVLTPMETHIAIGVRIYGDILPEENETFSLVITDPTNQWLGNDVELIATHTIINNDIFTV